MGMFTKPLEKIKHSGLLNNKYFNSKDALIYGTAATGAGVGYATGEDDHRLRRAAAGAILGGGGALAAVRAKNDNMYLTNLGKTALGQAALVGGMGTIAGIGPLMMGDKQGAADYAAAGAGLGMLSTPAFLRAETHGNKRSMAAAAIVGAITGGVGAGVASWQYNGKKNPVEKAMQTNADAGLGAQIGAAAVALPLLRYAKGV